MSEQHSKSAMLTIRMAPDRLEEFRIACMLRGTTMSSLVAQFATQVIREEMAAVPEAFRRREPGVERPLRRNLSKESEHNTEDKNGVENDDDSFEN